MEITHTQMSALETRQYIAFEADVAAWLHEHFPAECHILGEDRLRERIRFCLQVAAKQDFTARAEAMKYVYLCFLFGQDFDVVPQFKWLKEILCRREVSPSERMNMAFQEVADRYKNESALSA